MSKLPAIYAFIAVLLAQLMLPVDSYASHHNCKKGGVQVDQCVSYIGPGYPSPDYSADIVPDFDFGIVNQNETITKILTLGFTNNGTPSRLTSINITGVNAADFSITGGNCALNTPYNINESCTLEIELKVTPIGSLTAQLLASTADMTRTINLLASTTYPNAAEDPTVRGIVESQMRTSKRFSRTQILNLSRRMERLHQNRGSSTNRSSSFDEEVNKGRKMLSTLGNDPASSPLSDNQWRENTQGSAPRDESGELNPLHSAFINSLQYAANSGTINLAYSSDQGNGAPWLPEGTSIWAGGSVLFGSRDDTDLTDEFSYSTDGLSIGIDHRFSEQYTLGIAAGYANSDTEIGDNGSTNEGSGASITLYGSYMPVDNLFIDGMLGYGEIDLDSDRYVAPLQAYAKSDRDGDQLFGSVAVSYEFHKPGLTFSPYGRLDFSVDELDEASETGVGIYSLTYDDEEHTNTELSLGFRAESIHTARFGWVKPTMRFEFNHDFSDDYKTEISYTSLGTAGARYAYKTDDFEENSYLIGLGSEFIFRNGVKMGIDYQATHSLGPEHDQAINIWVAKNFDEEINLRNVPYNKYINMPIIIESGFTFDDNINRAVSGSDKLIDRLFDLSIGTGASFDLSKNSRLMLNASIGGQRLYRYHELERNSVDVSAEYQYRTSADFDAFTFGVSTHLSFDEYSSRLRDSDTRSLELSVRQSPTDRISWHASLSRNLHDADNKVFDNNNNELKLNLDYSLGSKGSLYFGHTIQDGYAVSSVPVTSYGYGNALSVIDDAFPDQGGPEYKAARFEADTGITTIGYNFPLGPDDSLDFSYRYIKATPDDPAVDSSSYRTDQFSIYYLTRF